MTTTTTSVARLALFMPWRRQQPKSQSKDDTTDHNDGVSILLKGSSQALRILQTLLRQIRVVGGNDDGDNWLDTTNHHWWVQPWLPDLGLAVTMSNHDDFDSSSAKMSRSSIGDGGTSRNSNHNLLLLLFRRAMEIKVKACMS
jgi:hypothetical protein